MCMRKVFNQCIFTCSDIWIRSMGTDGQDRTRVETFIKKHGKTHLWDYTETQKRGTCGIENAV